MTPRPFPGRAQLIAWGNQVYAAEQPAVRPRIGVLRGKDVEAREVGSIVTDHGTDALVQSAALLARTAEDDEPVFIFAYCQVSTKGPGLMTVKRNGLAAGYAASLLARTKSGLKFARIWQTEEIARGTRRTLSSDADAKTFEPYGDWTEPDPWIDALLEDALARADFPGAVRQIRKREATALSLISAASNDARKIAREPPPPLPTAPEPDDLELPWEAARAGTRELHTLHLGRLGTAPFTFSPAALPFELEKRSLEELMKTGWSSDAQACHLVRKINRAETAAATLEIFLSGDLPRVATMLGCVIAAELGYEARDLGLLTFATTELERRVEAAAASAGGMRAWLETQWPLDPSFANMLGTVGISCASNDAVWRLYMNGIREVDLPLTDDAPFAKGLRQAAFLRDWILDRAGIEAGSPGERIAALGRMVLHAVPSSDGEPRLERWQEAVRERRGQEAAALVLRDHAALHAAILHTVVVVTELRVARWLTFDELDVDGWRPEEASTAGLLKPGLEILARHVVHRAAMATDAEAQIALLERAHAIAPWATVIQHALNEARFRAERWDAALLDDLWKEANASEAIAPIAEALAVASAIGKKEVARSARRRLSTRAASGPHAWIAAVRAIFARPNELARIESIRKVEALARPTDLDANDRAVRALYGPGADPAATIAELEAALRAQRELIEEAELEREIRAEERDAARSGEAPRRFELEVPWRPGEDAVARAIAALAARVERNGVAKSAMRGLVEAHGARAAALGNEESSATIQPWLDAARVFVEAADSELSAALEIADEALEAALGSLWSERVLSQLATMRPLLPRAGSRTRELAHRTAAIEQAAAVATTPAEREAVEAEVLRLLDDAAKVSTHFEDDDEPERAEGVAPAADAFRAMEVLPWAVDRSRRELDTPEWAIAEGLQQVTQYNLARGRRDLKMLKGTRESGVPIWELRHYTRRSGIRVFYVLGVEGPRVCAFLAKVDDGQQNRVIERVKGWVCGS